MPIVPLPQSLESAESRSRLGWLLVRLTVAGIIGAHGWARWLAGGVAPFGGFLDAQGFPGGLYWAAAVTALEIFGSLFLLLGRWVVPLAGAFSLVYLLGIFLVHSKAGWFVVGLGRNGSEFSVLLIVALLALALQHLRRGSTVSTSRI